MNNRNHKRLLGLALAGSMAALQAPAVFAAAGDTISNTVTLSFQVGGVAQSDIVSAPAEFIEDRVINFSVTEGGIAGTTSVAPAATAGVTYIVTNNSNAPLDFSLTALQGTGDNFDTNTPVTFYLEDGTTPGYQAGEDTVAVTFLDEVAAGGGSVEVHVVATMPNDTVVTNGDIASITLVAQAAEGGTATVQGVDITNDDNGNTSPGGTASDTADDAAAMDTVFNEPAGTLDSTGVADVARNGQHSADDSFTISAAELTVTKTSVTLWDPVNTNSNPKSIPGAYVTYSVSIANAATAGASADLTTLADTLAASLDLDPDFITNAGPGNATSAAGASFEIDTTGTARPSAGQSYCTGAADADGCSYSGGAGGAISVDLATEMGVEAGYNAGELKPNETVVVRFNVIVQ